MTKEQLDLLFEYIESRLHTFVKGLPPGVTIGLKEREKEIKEKLYNEKEAEELKQAIWRRK
jgi:hypothetical protein